MKKIFILTAVFFMFLVLNSYATSIEVSGHITADTTWSVDTVNVVGETTVDTSVTLTISSGTLVLFQGHYKLVVDGTLLAIGTANNMITFTAADTSTGWHGIRFINTSASNDSSKIVYCNLHYGDATIRSGCQANQITTTEGWHGVEYSCGEQNRAESDGGAIYIRNFSKLLVNHCNITKNNATGLGGGISCDHYASPTIINSNISYNTAGAGGGIDCYYHSDPFLKNNTLNYNTSDYSGGAINTWLYSSPELIKNVIANNNAVEYGGGIAGLWCDIKLLNNLIYDNDAKYGGGVYDLGGEITNNTIVDNSSDFGGGIYFRNTMMSEGNPDIKNSILYSNTADTSGAQVYLMTTDDDPNFYYCNVEGASSAFGGSGANDYEGDYENNIDANPQFLGSDNYYLKPISPCVNAGIPNWTVDSVGICIDLAGNPRIYEGLAEKIDIGAYEYQNSIFSGTISDSTTWDISDTVYVIDDVTVRENKTLTIASGTIVNFAQSSEVTVNGELVLEDSSEFNLSQGSTVLIVGTNAELFLDWGAKIMGVEADDKITATRGGRITTEQSDQYDENDPSVIISAPSGTWGGIEIDTPDTSEIHWFVNCDISGIEVLNINEGKLTLYQSDFHDAESIIAEDGALLTIKGCRFYDNTATPIITDASRIDMDAAGDSLNYVYDNEDYGISLEYSTDDPSEIENTKIYDNSDGCRIRSHNVHIENCEIYDNDGVGIFANGRPVNVELDSTTIEDNGEGEYVGTIDSYDMADRNNTIADISYVPQTPDQYLLKASDWYDYYQEPRPIDVSGNTIATNDTTRFWPFFSAFDFGDSASEERTMYNDAMDDLSYGDYDDATATFQELINDYPAAIEAVYSVRGLYFIENFTDKDYAGFRTYLSGIPAPSETPMERMVRSATTKTYIDEGDYATAISRLEAVIADSTLEEDERIEAMLDEAYCSWKLSQNGGNRGGSPVSCTVNATTYEEYRDMVTELESRFSFNREGRKELTINTPAPAKIAIHNYPNPFNPITTLQYDIPEKSHVSLKIYDSLGRLIKTLVNETKESGYYSVTWDGTDDRGRRVPSAIYLYRLETERDSMIKRMLLLK
jgi:hypothetical protein